MKKLTAAVVLMLSVSPANAAEVFDQHIVSHANPNDMTRKILKACEMETEIPICQAFGTVKRTINKTASYAEKEITTVFKDSIEYLGIEEPVAVAGYITKVIIDKKVRINRLKLPLIENDSGSLEFSNSDVMWKIGWSF